MTLLIMLDGADGDQIAIDPMHVVSIMGTEVSGNKYTYMTIVKDGYVKEYSMLDSAETLANKINEARSRNK